MMKPSVLGPLILCAGLLTASGAAACGNETKRFLPSHRQVHIAEEALAQGRNKRAMLLLDHAYSPDAALQRRISRVMAVAEMRSLKSWNTDDPKYHVAPLTALRRLLKAEPDDPTLRARLAEALCYKPGGDAEALALLTDLASRDLMPDAAGWATLAGLRHRRGEVGERDAALHRCAQISTDPRQCPALAALDPGRATDR